MHRVYAWTWGVLVACQSGQAPPPEQTTSQAPVAIARSALQSIEASSFLSEDRSSFPAEHAFDGDRSTAWCEGVEGLGIGQALSVTLKKPTDIAEIRVDGGYYKDDRTLTNNGRPRKLAVASDQGWSVQIDFPFVPYREHAAQTVKEKPRVITQPGKATTLTFTLLEADEGRFTKDVCISEIALFAAP